MDKNKTFKAADRITWRKWLEKNHTSEAFVWLLYYKKDTGKPSVSYVESVEEAICFGWIDGVKKRIDEELYTHKFTPRNKKSRWSPTNIKRAEKMINAGKMTAAGLKHFQQRIERQPQQLQAHRKLQSQLTPRLEKALKKNQTAWKNFQDLAPSYQKQYIGWLRSAKKEETLQKRLKEAIQLLEDNKKLGMK